MKSQPASQVLVTGALAGLLAGAIVALWFLVVDLIAARPFDTPARLASLWLGEAYAGRWPRLITMYSLLHFGAFAVIGTGVAWFLHTVEVKPRLVLGAVVGLGVLSAVYYGGRLVQGADLLTAVAWPHVLGANLLGGMVMMAYLRRGTGGAVSSMAGHPMLLKGLPAGLLGAGAVALWFLVVDIVTNQPFFTPAALGSVLFLGASEPAAVQVNLGTVAAYTVLHVLAFWAIGMGFAGAAGRLADTPRWLMKAVFAFVVVELLFAGTVGLFAGWVLGTLGWISVGIGNLVAVLAMGWWTWATHPGLREQLSG